MKRIVRLLVFCWLTSLVLLNGVWANDASRKPIKAIFIYENPINAGGWSKSHEMARQALQQKYAGQVDIDFIEGVRPGGDVKRVLHQYASKGYDLVFATSFGYLSAVQNTARRFPHTRFFHCVGQQTTNNVGTYLTRAYQASYLAGVLAARMSKTHHLGYVAAMPVPEVLNGINAYTLGARSVIPDIAVQVVWTNSWADPSRESEAAELLIAAGSDVLTHHSESDAVMLTAQSHGVYAIGYQADRSSVAPKAHLASITHNWLPLYEAMFLQAQQGQPPVSLWYGFEHDAVGLSSLSKAIPQTVLDELEAIKQMFARGDKPVFAGPLQDNQGKQVVASGQTLSDHDIMAMDWLVDGVVGGMEK